MGGCFGCFRKKDDLNEVNQDDILWLQTNSSLTTGIPSNLHFSIGGLSDMSGQEPAVVTARKAQEKAEREKAKLEALKNKAATSAAGDSDKVKTTTSAKQGGGDEPQKISLETLMQDDANQDEPMTIKAAIQEPIKGKAESQEPIKGNASESQLSNGKDDAKAVVEAAKEALLPRAADVEREVEAEKAKLPAAVRDKVEAEGEASKAKSEVLPNENAAKVGNEVDTGVLEVGNDVKVSSLQTEAQADAMIKADAMIEADVTNEIKADVINKVQSDVSNNVQLDVITKSAIATQPSQVSLSFEVGAEANLIEADDEAEGGAIITEAVKLPDQSVATETVDTEKEVEISANQDGSTASEEPQIASEPHEVRNELQEDLNGDVEDDMACVDVSFSQPLVPQLSEVVRVGVIARVSEDDTPDATEPSNNDVVAEDGEGSDIVENVDE